MFGALNRSLRSRTLPFLYSYRSCGALKRFEVPQGGSLEIDFAETVSTPVKVDIVSQWQDHIEIGYDGDVGYEVNEEEQILRVKGGPSGGSVRVITPETINVYVNANEIDLNLQNKIEGDVHINCKAGNVSVDKVRGMEIAIDCGEAALKSKKLIEGDKVHIRCSDLKGKMVNGENVDLQSFAGSIEIDAVYANKIAAQASGDVKIDLLNGESLVNSTDGTVRVSNLDGAFKISADTGTVHLQVNKLMRGNSAWTAQGSSVTATKGGIQISVDPEVRATVDAQCFGVAGRAVVSMVSDSFEEYEQLTLPGGGPGGGPRPGHRQGLLTGQSAGAKRPEFQSSSGRSSGKINLSGAEDQSMQQTMSKTKDQSNGRDGGNEADLASGASSSRAVDAGAFDLTLRSHGHIRLETLSWIEIIRRKHGFGEADLAGLPPAEAGRTASSGQRVSAIMEEAQARQSK